MSAMSLSTAEEDRIVDLLRDKKSSTTIVLVGKPGSGKTRLAKKLSGRANFDFVLWVCLNRKYDLPALCKIISHQLFLHSTAKELELDDNVDIEEVQEEENLEKLEEKISKALEGKSFILLLDDEGNKMKAGEIKGLLPRTLQDSHKVLITSVNNDDGHKQSQSKEVIEVHPLSEEEALSLLKQRAGSEAFEVPGMEPLVKTFVARIQRLPAAIVIMAKALAFFCKLNSGVQTLERALKEAFDGENRNVIQLLCSAHEMLPSSILVDCAWRGGHYFRDCGSVHYNELIAYWILEGYLGSIDCVEKAYEKGHRILMELIDCGLLKKVEADCVILERSVEADYILTERAKLNLDSCNRWGFDGIASLGLADLFEDGKRGGFGRITQADGIIRTPCKGEKEKKLSTLLLDGNHLCQKFLNKFNEPNHKLRVLAIFNPTFESPPLAFSFMEELNMLVLRGCDFLVKTDYIREFAKLTVLEISGACSLIKLPDDIFKKMNQLQSLNLSSLQIQSLPTSFYDLTELQRLLITDCPNLVKLKMLKKCDKLVVFNLSGSTSLKEFPYKNLRAMKKLRMLDLSNTKITILPIFGEIQQLTHILLRDCCAERLPSIVKLTCLQVLDLSGAKEFVEIQDPSLKANTNLEILDLSGTNVVQIPSNIEDSLSAESKEKFFEHLGKLQILNISKTTIKTLPSLSNLSELRQLLLSCCSSLVTLPDLNNLVKLEVLDLSGCSDLKKIEPESFDRMTCLQRLILSETEIKSLPDLSKLCKLRLLLLNKCTKLKEFPQLESLTKLEELNLCSVPCLGESADFLKNMVQLQILDLSETHIKLLPSMSKLNNLTKLFLRGCKHLVAVEDLDALTKLGVLDLSGTALTHLPSLSNLTNLRHLLLRDCPNLEKFSCPEMLDLSGPVIKELPYDISTLTHLEQLELPNMMNIEGADREMINCLEEEVNLNQWHISSLPEMLTDSQRPFISMSSSKFFQLLEENDSLWDKSFKRFRFSVQPVDQQNKKGGVPCYRDEFDFRHIYFQARCFSYFKEEKRTLEICGFHHLPTGIERVLSHAECLYLLDNAFIKDLHDLDAKNIDLIKGCWIERCQNMESVFHANEVDGVTELGREIEILWLSNVLKLTTIYSGNVQHTGFQNLKCMYLDCCPEIKSVSSLAQLPKNLEVLQIKFCDKLKALFDGSAQCTLQKLHTLHLLELPNLESIGCMMPSLQNRPIIKGCPKLQRHEVEKHCGDRWQGILLED
ncbi:Disease resistance protein [Actinidia chinensis var. chinensis]|uniref:Disease resistance protein n=1 Tax=Actinidia chinensis var. chinensis TaxID=1590841 RepID=A0A2R6Q7X3_ACTCC|nr:Disease resistance protein [Actinidia chinensis var. chinensis]